MPAEAPVMSTDFPRKKADGLDMGRHHTRRTMKIEKSDARVASDAKDFHESAVSSPAFPS
jgi:hypothetical protein